MDGFKASGIKVEICSKDCSCQSVHVVLSDGDGEEIAVASLSPQMARDIALGLECAADLADTRRVQQKGVLI